MLLDKIMQQVRVSETLIVYSGVSEARVRCNFFNHKFIDVELERSLRHRLQGHLLGQVTLSSTHHV